ncbi:MAG: hypothetical protein R3B06_05325 [Kofleriaceae bacterium]
MTAAAPGTPPGSSGAADQDPRAEAAVAARPLRRPVKWLFAPDLIAYTKRLFLHAFYGGELDPRDWMRIEDGHAHVEDASADPGRECDLRATPVVAPPSGELWFDYIADTGDGGAAMFTTAYAVGATLTLPAGVDLATPSTVIGAPAAVAAPTAGATTLPRGQFLLVGGDTAYHVADIDTLIARVQVPFTRAARALAAVQPDHPPRRLYGIPGNHDYYAQLTGFNRMFRHGVTGDHERGPGGRRPLLAMPGYQRAQDASYLAIRLPWDWLVLGLDVDDWMDARQEWYFRSLPTAARLIVATPSPPIVLGAVVANDAHRDGLARLGLPPLFDGAAPAPGTCRLDLSGDTHHYARYQPGAPAPVVADVGLGQAEPAPTPAAYVSVVSGGGGAFHHPSFPDVGALPARARYPRAAVSRRAVSQRLLEPWSIFDGGLAWIMPLVLTLVAAFGATRSAGTRWLCDGALGWLGVDRERAFGGAARPLAPVGPDDLAPSLAFLGFGVMSLVLWYVALRLYGVFFTPAQRRDPGAVAAFFGRLSTPARRALAAVAVAAAILVPFSSPWFVRSPLAATLWFNAWWLLAVTLTVASGVAIGLVGGRLLAARPRAAMVGIGLVHGLVHVLTPFVIARLALVTWWVVPAMVVILTAPLVLGRRLLRGGTPWWTLLALWLGPWLGAVALAVIAADGVALAPVGAGAWAVVVAVTAVVSIAIGCAHMGWYLTVSAALGAHGNEVGGAARIDRFRQFIRFRLTAAGLTGFVIAIDRPSADPAAIAPYVVDVFTVAPAAAPPP